MNNTVHLLWLIPLLISCYYKKQYINHEISIKNTKGFYILMGQLSNHLEKLWGRNEVLMSGPKDYVKYINNFYTRIYINVDNGMIKIESIDRNKYINYLRKSIINILLMYNHYTNNNLLKTQPFFYGQVLDNYHQPIRLNLHAAKFADFLLQTHLKSRTSGPHNIWFININLVPNHIDHRSKKYLKIVNKISHKYGINQSLILSIIQIESSFNPYAVSNTNALGLMQIKQNSAGREVFKMKNKLGQPSRSYLLNPENNIDIGTAYLAILQNNYLNGIVNSISRRYAVIVAYNSGVSTLLKVFSPDPNKALKIINTLQPDDVYKILCTNHPSLESRSYLYKVNNLQKKYKK
ncbi:membrane-bound lytic murein transglycosylase MltC [Candidatus Palibaumannia cicadellinicola]|uniref:Membrane-bound lytic murein transglycosylase C n=1 Tax=Candidatus Palibaumannia cicadellinicola TaxID=186490 RepID=A0A0K2BLT7_9GAMM|nr:membrane-bound lytic murein transglycosylase MltC [Candidatus Baumannia cicadellinicola]AKZ66013.1 Membrane-bound lytic murein transglycosylase C precursor [Candidatus Baumannia cicadellinicola]